MMRTRSRSVGTRLVLALRNLNRGWPNVLWVCLALAGAGVGIYFSFFFKGGSPYSLQETLPKMVSAFGSDARAVQILVSSDNVSYEVIARDGLLHRRVYNLLFSRVVRGRTGKSREINDSVRKATASELSEAQLTLGQLAAGVVENLYHRVNFPSQGSSATLTGETWSIQSGVRPFDKYEARYDGTGLHQTQSKATVFGRSPSGQTKTQASTQSNVATSSSITVTSSGGVTSSAAQRKKLNRLVACIQRAKGDVSKIAALRAVKRAREAVSAAHDAAPWGSSLSLRYSTLLQACGSTV
jgi:hypothetical protein